MHRLSRGDWPTNNGDNITDDGINKGNNIREKNRAGQSSTTSNSHHIGVPRSTVAPTVSPDDTVRDNSLSSSRSRRSGRPVRKLLSATENSLAEPASNVDGQAPHQLDEPSYVVQPDNCLPDGRDVTVQPPISSVSGAAQTSPPTAARHRTYNQRPPTSRNSTASEGNGTSSQRSESSSPATELQPSPTAARNPASKQRHSNSGNTTVSEGPGTASLQPPTSSHHAQPSPTAPSSPTSNPQPPISANSTVSEGPATPSSSAKFPTPEPISSIDPRDAIPPQQSPSSISPSNPRTSVTADSESSNITRSTERAKVSISKFTTP